MLAEPKGSNRNRIWITQEEDRGSGNSADFDEAIAETGYGTFNILLLLAALPVGWTCVLDTTSAAFILQSSECVFELTWLRKGLAVGIVYIGMTLAGPLWDLVLRDSLLESWGKRNTILAGMILNSVCNIVSVNVTSFYIFALCKFINGLLIAGPLSVAMSYLTDFHSAKYQSTFTKWANLLFVVSNIIPAALACTLILYSSWFNFTIFNWFYETWRVYLLICALPSVLGVVTVSIMPKSPRFLSTRGQSRDALRILKMMYSMNKLESGSKFKITKLISQRDKDNGVERTFKDKIRDNVAKLKALLSTPHLRSTSVFLTLHFVSMLGFNTMRLWVPQLFVILNNFRVLVKPFYPCGESITMCEMIFPRIQKINYSSCNYTLPALESAVYVNSTIIATSAVSFAFFFIVAANTELRKHILIALSFLMSAVASFGMNWVAKIPYMLVLCSFIIVTCRISSNSIAAFHQEVAPKNLRMALTSCTNFVGNVGAAVGSIAFALILELNCLSALMGIGCLMLGCLALTFFLIEKPDQPLSDQETNKERY